MENYNKLQVVKILQWLMPRLVLNNLFMPEDFYCNQYLVSVGETGLVLASGGIQKQQSWSLPLGNWYSGIQS